MYMGREVIQCLVSSIRLRRFLKHILQDVPRELFPSPETQPDELVLLIVRVVDQYAHHIAGIEITKRIFK